MEPVLNQTCSAVFYFCVAVFALLAGCAIAPEPDMPEGLIDQKVELVGRINESPTDLDAHADLLRLQIRDGDAEGAQATCFHALKHNGADYRAHLLSAQFYRWQVDLISAEKSLLAARDLAPTRLEPRVALSALYHQTYMEEAELEERRVAFTLAEPAWREEFRLDYAYACAQLGRDDQATELVLPLAGNGDARKESRSRAFALLAEINLREERFDAVATSLQAACKLTPAEHGYVQLAARMATVLDQPEALAGLFDEALSTQDAAEARWAALFGKWMLQVRADV